MRLRVNWFKGNLRKITAGPGGGLLAHAKDLFTVLPGNHFGKDARGKK
jgi:hypothetical protein